ncbi:hypothetical protein [Hymenobacter glacialis]|uniref:Uncharacterized protein n=1 Tax=Hymenobacter glacialis TaxID=1908236 RepID=A0A1G1T1I9_9BACT|nr:hypothetical protein [Hymenobacter glacialis]OGX84696.1 hypothetical protein BEN48_02880 [Hymenobacter glacialis]
MKKRSFPHHVAFLLCSSLAVGSCEKKQVAPQTPSPSVANPAYQDATIIGFDPCTGTSGRGLVLAFAKDTVVTYTFPAGVYEFPAALFQNGSIDCFFPTPEAAKYRVRVAYYSTPNAEKVYSLCLGIINLADFNRVTKGRQIIITTAEKRP